MAYSFVNPRADQLLEFVSLRAKLDPAEALTRLQAGLNSGRTKLEDLWVLQEATKTLAAFSIVKMGLAQHCIVRCLNETSDAAITELLHWLAAKAIANQTELIVHFSSLSARDVTDLPLGLGWKFESHAVVHRTYLADRTDLKADSNAVKFELEELKTARFLEFYNPIWSVEPEHFSESVHEAITDFFERYLKLENPTGYYLFDQNKPVAAGLLRTTRDGATIDMLGVLPNFRQKGWGNRLHRHLLFAAKELADSHFGGTDFSNTAMRRLLEKNGCTINEEQWAFAYCPK